MRVALEALAALTHVALMQVDGNELFRYRPASPMLAETVRNVVELCIRKPLAIVKTIYASPTDKIQTLADAFGFRKQDHIHVRAGRLPAVHVHQRTLRMAADGQLPPQQAGAAAVELALFLPALAQ
jgi:hypothetical protein